MPQRIPMPDCLSFFLMVGNETSELAAHIASSVRDHCEEPDNYSVSCISLVDSSFDKETVMEGNLHYSCGEPNAENLRATAIQVIRMKLQEIMEKVESRSASFPYQLNKINYVIVADASGSYQLSDLDELRKTLISEMQAEGKKAVVLLCLIAHNDQAQVQRRWLMTEDGQLRPEIDGFMKVLVLTPQNIHGFSTISTARDMQDAAFPALIMMMNGHMMTDPTRLYTAAYKKQGGTSNDILELKRHIAANTLDGFFADQNALNRNEVLDLLSTETVRFNGSGTTLAEKVMQCANAYVPQLRHLALTADLESKDFNPVQHILEFDELNRESMITIGDWPERWLEEVKGKLHEEIHLDALLHQLDENNPDGMVTEILQTWSDFLKKSELAKKPDALQRRMDGVTFSAKKGFLQKWQDHNLMLLNAAVEIYADVCRERIAFRLLSCLQRGLGPLRTFLRDAIDQRRAAFKPYQMPSNKLRVLTEMCSSAAAELEKSYRQTGLVETLPTYIQFQNQLYTEDGHHYWTALYREFLNRGKQTSSFAEAIVMNATPDQVVRKVLPLGESIAAMIPSYPDELGSMPLPIKVFLVNRAVADMMEDVLQDSQVFSVPGDLLEHVSLFPLSNSLEPLTRLTMFRNAPGLSLNATPFYSAVTKGSGKTKAVEATDEREEDLNPWKIRIVDVPSGKLLSWVYPASHDDTIIRFNGEILRGGYSYTDYIKNGKGLLLKNDEIPQGNVRIEMECGEEYQRYEIKMDSERTLLSSLRFTGAKAKSNDCLLILGSAYIDNSEKRCLVFADDPQAMKIPFYTDEKGEINPLWCMSEAETLMIEDLE